MNNEQIIDRQSSTHHNIVYDVLNNINQLFQISENQFQDLSNSLGIEVTTEELGGGTKYSMGYKNLGNNDYPTNDYLVFWADLEHKEYYIYVYRETEDVYTSESIVSNVWNALWNSFDVLMEYRIEELENQDMHCSTCKCNN